MMKISETITENIFRDSYGYEAFVEKNAIATEFGFKSKNGTDYSGYPDFFRDEAEFSIVVEAKAENHQLAVNEVQFYMQENKIEKNIIGIAISGQKREDLEVDYFYRYDDKSIAKIEHIKNTLLSVEDIRKLAKRAKYGDMITTGHLIAVLKDLNKKFHNDGKVRDTD